MNQTGAKDFPCLLFLGHLTTVVLHNNYKIRVVVSVNLVIYLYALDRTKLTGIGGS